tara:strand:+ start:737 stop:1225 length:489 start_codon:yes stop_codon:yes gene_type:complete
MVYISIGWGAFIGFAIGTYKDPLDIKGNFTSAAIGVALTRPFILDNFVVPAARSIGSASWEFGSALVNTTLGSIAAGYVLGAAVGTGIVTAKWGWNPEGETMGGADVMSFYTLGITGEEEHKPTLRKILNTYEYAPRTGPGKHLQYLPNLTWLWGRENIAYI